MGVVSVLVSGFTLEPAGAGAEEPAAPVVSEPSYPSVVSEEQLIEMDDGVQLAATVFTPSLDGGTPAPGPFPVVVSITPYGRTGLCSCGDPTQFARRGMVGVVVDTRGTGGSGGDLSENYFSPREAKDGAALIDHFGTRDYSTGKVGMIGGSYVGITQLLAAGQGPEHLAAIVPAVPLSDLYRDAFAHGGVVNLSFDLQYIAVQGVPGYVAPNTDPYLLEQTVLAKLGQSPPGSIAFDYLARPDDDPFYADRSPITYADAIDVPVLIMSQWRDGLLRGAPELFAALADRDVETRLFMDPCTHKGCGAPFAPLTDPPNRVDSFGLQIEFLERHLLGADTPDRPVVTYYLQGADTYASAAAWPPPETSPVRLALAEGERLAPVADAVAPVGTPPPTQDPAATADYVVNPAAGLTAAFSQYGTVAASPYLPLDQRLEGPQGLTFRTEAVTGPTTIAGPIAVHLVAASTAPDTDWHVKVADVAPDGTESIITDGSLRASHRTLDMSRSRVDRPYHTHTDYSPIEPGTFYAYDIEVWPTAHQLAPGHRLQVRLTSSDLPTHLPGRFRVDVNDPTSIEIVPHQPAVNTVALDDSYLVLPLVGGLAIAPDAVSVDLEIPPADPPVGDGSGSLAATGAGDELPAVAVSLVALAMLARRRHRRS